MGQLCAGIIFKGVSMIRRSTEAMFRSAQGEKIQTIEPLKDYNNLVFWIDGFLTGKNSLDEKQIEKLKTEVSLYVRPYFIVETK